MGKARTGWRVCTLYPAVFILVFALAGCGTLSKREQPASKPSPPSTAKGGGYYLDDGPGDKPPAEIDRIPDAVPKIEPLHRGAMRPYTVMGRQYTPMTAVAPYKARGVASWYGRRYHGKQTSTGEIYDMYAMSAAHPTLPLPSYVRVTSLASGKSVVVRVNDRGPFIDSRLIDLSYTAAHRIGILAGGSGQVEVEAVFPGAAPPVIAAAPAVPAPRVVETPAPSPEPATTAERAIPLAADASGLYLQLAAFGSRDNADAYAARLQSELAWLATPLQVYISDGLFRVHAGPYANQSEARQAADRISESLGIKPMILIR
jgi:rare lipoprotein A